MSQKWHPNRTAFTFNQKNKKISEAQKALIGVDSNLISTLLIPIDILIDCNNFINLQLQISYYLLDNYII